jgi:hypothetical protein
VSIKIFLLSISFITLFGQNNPILYAPFGDKLYDANEQFSVFADHEVLSAQIRSYQVQCDTLRNIGLEMEAKAHITDTERNDYLVSLRGLEENYFRIIRKLQNLCLKSIGSNDYSTFRQIADTSLSDLWLSSSLSDQAIGYYQQHKNKGKIESIEQLIKTRQSERVVASVPNDIPPQGGTDYTKAAGLFLKACNEGYYRACTNLGNAYFHGKGVSQDSAMAIKYYTKACEGGDANGCRNLGNGYVHGIGVTKDFVKAANMYTKSCELGNSDGCINLGNIYYHGQGIPKNRDKAMQLYKNACDSGNNRGCTNLGNVYYIDK